MGGRVGGGGGPACSQREGKRVSTEPTEGQVKEHRAGVWSELEYAAPHSRQTPKIEPWCVFFSSYCCEGKATVFTKETSLPDRTQGEAEGALQWWTKEGLWEGGSPPWGLPGDGVQATFSGRYDSGASCWMVGWIQLSFTVDLYPFVVELSLSPSQALTSPPSSHALTSLPPSLSPSKLYSQMLNLTGLLVKSASTDGFHLGTGLLDPPFKI